LRLPTFAKFIDEFKLRSAFGRSGTAPTYGFNYPNSASCTPAINAGYHALPCGYQSAIQGINLNDVHLKPEQSAETEAGVDITMFQSRAQFSGTVYNKQVTDLVLFEAPAGSSGITQEVVNGGRFHNQGIELSLQMSPISSAKGLTWISNTTFYRNYSRVDALPNENTPIVTANQFGGGFGTSIVAVGRSISEIVNSGVTLKNGLNQQVGDATPADVISFNQQLSFGHLHLSGVLDWYVGGTVANLTNAYYDNPLFLLADSAGSAARLKSNAAGGTPWVESARFVKLREVRLSWDMPDSWVKFVGQGHVRTVRIDISGRNLLYSFPYTGLDPEVSNFGNLAVGRGQDVTPYPPARSVFFGIDLGL